MKMKNTIGLLSLAITFAVFAVESSEAQVNYKARELSATPQVKLKLASMRSRIQAKKLTFSVGHTYATERGLKNVTGGKRANVTPAVARQQNVLAAKLIAIDNDARLQARAALPKLRVPCSAGLKTWDWRREGKVTGVKAQQCGNCWAYAAVSALESSYLIRNNLTIDGSEQYVVANNTNKAGTCEGGRADLAISFLVTGGTTTESTLPDSGKNGTADPNMQTPYDGVIWGWANPDNPGNPGVESIKEGLCEYGPMATWIDAGGSFGAYTGANEYGDVYNDDDDKEAGHEVGGHFVTIIGWDETRGAWLVKNSWGSLWGFNAGFGTEVGYGWIKYGTHSVGSDVSWVRAKGTYTLPKIYYDALPSKRITTVQPLLVRPPVINRPPPIRIP